MNSAPVTSPAVSVLLPVYNAASYVGQSIESILTQTFGDFELILIDDGSTDDSYATLDSWARRDARIVLVRTARNLGLIRTLNRGLGLARGEFIARQDADDCSEPQRLERQVAFLRAHAEVGLLGAAYHAVDARGRRLYTFCPPQSDTAIRWMALFQNPFCHTSMMFRRALAAGREASFYDERALHAEDYELWVRLLEQTRGTNLAEPLVRWRKHSESVSVLHEATQTTFATELARRQMLALLPGLAISPDETARLRAWHNSLPLTMTRADLALCARYFDLLDALAARADSDPAEIARIRTEPPIRILRFLSARASAARFWACGLLPAWACYRFCRSLVRQPRLALAAARQFLEGRSARTGSAV